MTERRDSKCARGTTHGERIDQPPTKDSSIQNHQKKVSGMKNLCKRLAIVTNLQKQVATEKKFLTPLLCPSAILAIFGTMVLLLTPNQAQAQLQGYWAFNEGAGGTAIDYSGNGNNGVIQGATYTANMGGQSGLSGDYSLDFGTVNQ